MVLVLVLGGGFGWVVHRAKVQRDAVAAVKRAGGVFYDLQSNPSNQARSWAPRWLIERVGVDYFGRVIVADLHGASMTDADLAPMEVLTDLRTLYLYDTEVTDTGLAHLEGLASLETLSLAGTRVTDAGLVHLKGLTRLRTLALDKTRIGDAGLAHLRELTGLTALYVRGTRVTDEGLAEFHKVLPGVRIARP